eukprot:12571713-Ditylum_brightwellii.AAC.1
MKGSTKGSRREKYDSMCGTTQKAVEPMLRMMQSIWHSSHAVVMDSGFCVLRGIVELAKRWFIMIQL